MTPDSNVGLKITKPTGATYGLYVATGQGFIAENFVTNGSTTLGDSTTADSTTISGQTTITSAATASNGLQVTYNGTTGTTGNAAQRVDNNGTYNTTSAQITNYSLLAVNSATRSSGANNLVNIGLDASASGGQVNRALQTDSGDVVLNVTSGSTTANLNFLVNGNTTLGDATTDTTTINGTATIADNGGASLASANGNLIIQDTTSAAAGVGGELRLDGNYTGTTSTTAAGIKAMKSNGTAGNYDFDLAFATRVNGAGDLSAARLKILAAGTSTFAADANTDVVAINNANTGQTSDTKLINGSQSGTYDATAAARTAYGDYQSVTSTRSAGNEFVSNVAIYGAAPYGNAQVANALQTGEGSVVFAGDTGTFGTNAGQGLAVGFYQGAIAGGGGLFQSGAILKNFALRTDDLANDTGTTNSTWGHVNYAIGSTLVYASSTDVAAPTTLVQLTSNIAKLTCTNGTTNCSAGGSDYRLVLTSSTTYLTDLRNQTVTFSVWLRYASGSGSPVIMLGRYSDNDQGSLTCPSTGSSGWTRCVYTRTFNNTSYTDNSELRMYIQPRSTTAMYAWGAQAEWGNHATPYEENGINTSTAGWGSWAYAGLNTSSPPSYSPGTTGFSGMDTWAGFGLGVGNTHEDPNAAIAYDGSIYTRAGETFGDSSSDKMQVNATATFTPTATFSNGAAGINYYTSKYFEWNDDWLGPVGSTSNNGAYGIWGCKAAGTNASCSLNKAGALGRPGIQQVATGTTTTGNGGWITDVQAIAPQSGDNFTLEFVGGWPTLSNSTDGYSSFVGFWDSSTSTDQVDGCYVLYDERQTATAPATGSRPAAGSNTLACVCSSNSTRTEYPMDGTTVSDESFTTVAATAAAMTWPSTNVFRIKVVLTGTTRAEFYINGTKSCDINSHIPSGSARLFGPGWNIVKSVGTTTETLEWDFTSLSYTLGTARS
jgi:hypothetical protein